MDRDEVFAGLTEIVRAALGQPALALTRETTAKDVAGWDSLKQVIVILEAEARFGVTLPSREVDRIQCVGDFVDAIAARA